MKNMLKFLIVTLCSIFFIHCGGGMQEDKNTSDVQESAQQIGDALVSIDESTGSTNGSFLNQSLNTAYSSPIVQESYCRDVEFTSCSNGIKTREFAGCSLFNGTTMTGNVTLTFSQNNCSMATNLDSIIRAPSFSMTGRRGGVLSVTTPTGSYGQKITRISTSPHTFRFENAGIRRTITSGTRTLYDFTTQIESAAGLTITGNIRNGRVLSTTGGTLKVTNHLSGVSCEHAPTNVTWGTTCNCPISGSWTTTCSDGKTGSLTHTGCGTASITLDDVSTSVEFERCYSLQ